MTEIREREIREREIRDNANKGFRAFGGNPPKGRSAALGLWEGLSHSASLRSIVIVLKSHSASLRLIVTNLFLVPRSNPFFFLCMCMYVHIVLSNP